MKRGRPAGSTAASKASKSRASSIASSNVAISNHNNNNNNNDDDEKVVETAANDIQQSEQSNGANNNALLFKNLHLRCVVKESHNTPIRHIVVNRLGKHFDNLIATVADKFASIYTTHDDSDVLDLFSIFENHGPVPATAASLSDKDLQLYAATWLVPIHERDAFLVVAGEDCVIHLISLAHQDEFFQLKGHDKPVVALDCCRSNRDLLLSLSKDKTFRLWDVNSLSCRAVYSMTSLPLPTSIRLSTDGTLVYSGDAQGQLRTWRVPTLPELPTATTASMNAVAADASKAAKPLQFDESAVLATVAVPSKGKLGSRISCIRQAPGAIVVLNNFGRLAILHDNDDNDDDDDDGKSNNAYNNNNNNTNNNSVSSSTANTSTSLRQNGNHENNNSNNNDNNNNNNNNNNNAIDRWQLQAAPIAKKLLRDWEVDSLVTDSTFDVTADGKHIVIGSDDGDMKFYQISDGAVISTADHDRCSSLVKAEFANNGREIVAISNSSLVWRWRYIEPVEYEETKQEFKTSLLRTQVTKELQQKGKIGEISAVEDAGLIEDDEI